MEMQRMKLSKYMSTYPAIVEQWSRQARSLHRARKGPKKCDIV